MKKTALVFVLLVLILFIPACSSDSGNVNKTDKTAAELLDIVLKSIEFPPTVEVTEESAFEEMGIDLSLAEDYAAVKQMLSVDVAEVIVLKVKEGEEENALEQLKSRKEALINYFAYYPEQVESANATVVGSEGNVVYLICHVDAEKGEEGLLGEIYG